VADTFHLLIEGAALVIELLAVAVIVSAVVLLAFRRGTVRYLFEIGKPGAFESYRLQLGKALLLGLELLVAADVIRTVTLAPTVNNIAMLGLLVLIRTFLSWAMIVELEGHWPWQAPTRPQRELPNAE
jgi:uncharacterized membrane protein